MNILIQTKVRKKHQVTPLRYPGGKSILTDFFARIIDSHFKKGNITYIEPYAGGAGAALALLLSDKVTTAVINDYDPAIYSFWKLVVNHPDKIIELIRNTPVTIEEWKKQKQIYSHTKSVDYIRLGFATFYLNRTNRAGILNAGPIGGMAQHGEWKLNARYNKQALIDRIQTISLYKDKITVQNKDGLEIIKEYADKDSTFFYIDPPYCDKGSKLYLNFLTQSDHARLARLLHSLNDRKWLLSYNESVFTRNLYEGFAKMSFPLRYSVHPSTKLGRELMIFSDSINIANCS